MLSSCVSFLAISRPRGLSMWAGGRVKNVIYILQFLPRNSRSAAVFAQIRLDQGGPISGTAGSRSGKYCGRVQYLIGPDQVERRVILLIKALPESAGIIDNC